MLQLNRSEFKEAYRRMRTIREFEERLRRQMMRDKLDNPLVQESFDTGSMPQIHVSLGALQSSRPETRVSGD